MWAISLTFFPSIFMCSLLYCHYYFLRLQKVQRSGSWKSSPDDASPRRGRKWQGVTGSLWSCVYPRMSQANTLLSLTLQLDFSQPKQSDNCWNASFFLVFFLPPSRGSSVSERGKQSQIWLACCHEAKTAFAHISIVVMMQQCCTTTQVDAAPFIG